MTPTLKLIRGGKYEPRVTDEARAVRDIYAYERRVVRAEPRPDLHPPRAA